MAYLTPPRTRKGRKYGFFKAAGAIASTPNEPYYEDIYGVESSDEDAEGGGDHCESETDSDEERTLDNHSTRRRQSKVSGRGAEGASGDSAIVIEESDADNDDRASAEPQFRIAPQVNARRSVPAGKLLKRKRTGMFVPANDKTDTSSEDDDVERDTPVRKVRPEEVEQINKAAERDQPTNRSSTARPASRKLLARELREHDRKKKAANQEAKRGAQATKRNVREMARPTKAAKRTIKKRAERRTAFVLVDSEDEEPDKAKATRTAFVLVDGGDVEGSEYRRYE